MQVIFCMSTNLVSYYHSFFSFSVELVKDDELVSVEGGDPLEFCVESATPIARDVTVRVDVVVVDSEYYY